MADAFKLIGNLFGGHNTFQKSADKIITNLRLPRAFASFLVGGALSVSGLVYQNTFNNKLISPDILGVSTGRCVGAGAAILWGLDESLISVVAFASGIATVLIAMTLPKFFKSKATITLVLSGIIVGAFANSIIGLLKYLAGLFCNYNLLARTIKYLRNSIFIKNCLCQ